MPYKACYDEARTIGEWIVQTRRQLHRFPELMYEEVETSKLVRETLDGLGMLVNQGVISFKIWTGVDPDPNVMREALEEYLEL